MEFLIFLGIVAIIIVIVVVIKKKAKKKAIEELYGSTTYSIAEQIKNELNKRGYNFGEPETTNSSYGLYGCFHSLSKKEGGEINIYINIYYSNYIGQYNMGLSSARNEYWGKNAFKGNRLYGIENYNIGIMVFSDEESQEMPEYIKIAAEVMESSGYGKSIRIEELATIYEKRYGEAAPE